MIRVGDENTTLFHQIIRAREFRIRFMQFIIKMVIGKILMQQFPTLFLTSIRIYLGVLFQIEEHQLCKFCSLVLLLQRSRNVSWRAPTLLMKLRLHSCLLMMLIKAPDLDEFRAHFYKDVWKVVSDDIIQAVLDFFQIMKASRRGKFYCHNFNPKSK